MYAMVSPYSPRLCNRTTAFHETKAKTQGQLNGNIRVARSEYGRIDVSKQRFNAYFIIWKKQNSPNINVELAKKWRENTAPPRFTVLTWVGQGIFTFQMNFFNFI